MPAPSVCYLIESFPQPSETFVADEALSVQALGSQVLLLYRHDGSSEKAHPSARSILEQKIAMRVQESGYGAMLWALLGLLAYSPWQTLVALRRVMASDLRWAYRQALPSAWLCRRQGVAYVHAHFADFNAVLARAISGWTGIPFGITTHGYDIFFDPLDSIYTRELYRSADLIVTISRYNRRHMVQKYGLPAERISVVHSGVDLTRFPYVEHKRFAADGVLRLLNVGRLVPVKAQDTLLRAMRLLRDRGVAVQLDIIGAGPRHDELLQLRAELGLDDCVRLRGAQLQDEVQRSLAKADIFVLSSRSEGLPVVCIEAMASGTPTIATRITGLPELIEHGHNGLLFEPDDAASLADAVLRLQASPALMHSVRQQARRTVEQTFEREGCTRQLMDLWQSAIAARQQRVR